MKVHYPKLYNMAHLLALNVLLLLKDLTIIFIYLPILDTHSISFSSLIVSVSGVPFLNATAIYLIDIKQQKIALYLLALCVISGFGTYHIAVVQCLRRSTNSMCQEIRSAILVSGIS